MVISHFTLLPRMGIWKRSRYARYSLYWHAHSISFLAVPHRHKPQQRDSPACTWLAAKGTTTWYNIYYNKVSMSIPNPMKVLNYIVLKPLGYSCLYIAASKGHLNIVQLLIQHGANINACTKKGFYSLYVACEHNHLVCCDCIFHFFSKLLNFW